MRTTINLLTTASVIAAQLAIISPAAAAPGDRQARPAPQAQHGMPGRPAPTIRPAPQMRPAPVRPAPQPAQQSRPSREQAVSAGFNRPATNDRRPSPTVRPDAGNGFHRPQPGNRPEITQRPGIGNRPGTSNRPGGINRPGGGYDNRYPVYRPPGGGYYRPPGGGFHRPPRPPFGGWHGGYFPPPSYYYYDGPSVGAVLFGVAVTTSLLALLSAASRPSSQTIIIEGAPPPPLPLYTPPPRITGEPAQINVDINGMSSDARPSASTCLTEAARQISATGGNAISIESVSDIEKGNGGHRFRMTLLGVYPDETRAIPMYCRATPDTIVELSFG